MKNNPRIACLQKQLKSSQGILFEDPTELLYLTGKAISTGILILDKNQSSLIVDGRYFSACQNLPGLKVILLGNDALKKLLSQRKIKTLYFDSLLLSYARASQLKKTLGKAVSLLPKEGLLKTLRAVKDPQEIKVMKAAAQLLYSCYEKLLGSIKEGMSEKQLALSFKVLGIQNGASGFSFEPIFAFGENAAYPHHRPTDRKLKKGDLILIDIGLEKDHYQSDMTRVVFFGNVPQELLKLHDVVLAAHDAALALCKPGVKFKDLDVAARRVMKKHKLEKYFIHSLGHGIGLETHEGLRIKFDHKDAEIRLEPGMVFTIEPGLYLEGKGGIRYEDTIVITPSGYENFFPNKKTKFL